MPYRDLLKRLKSYGSGSASFEAEPPASTSEGFRLVGSTTRVGRGGSRHGEKQATSLLPSDSLSDTLFLGTTIVVSSDTVAQVAGITGRSSPAPQRVLLQSAVRDGDFKVPREISTIELAEKNEVLSREAFEEIHRALDVVLHDADFGE